MDTDVLRIIDASLNRLREALRVVEDHLRFVLDDAELAGRTRAMRHRAAGIARRMGESRLLEARCVEMDVGRVHALASAGREDPDHVVAAALSRATEAARSVAEYARLLDEVVAGEAERLRYELYALAQAIRLRGALRHRFRGGGVYLVLSEQACRRPWLEVAEAALQAGVRCIQLREKRLADRAWLERARRLRDLTVRHEALLIVNDRPDIARLAGADGVHVGPDDLDPASARRIVGGGRLVGLSTRSVEQVRAAEAAGADYLAVGAMFPTRTKPDATVRGVGLLEEIRAHSGLPIVAIGGVTPQRVGVLRQAGATLIAVCSAICGAEDPGAAAGQLLRAWREAAR